MPPVPSAPLSISCIAMTRHHLFTFYNCITTGVSWTRLWKLFAGLLYTMFCSYTTSSVGHILIAFCSLSWEYQNHFITKISPKIRNWWASERTQGHESPWVYVTVWFFHANVTDYKAGFCILGWVQGPRPFCRPWKPLALWWSLWNPAQYFFKLHKIKINRITRGSTIYSIIIKIISF